jgi:DNA-binding transcriptional MerR regulator
MKNTDLMKRKEVAERLRVTSRTIRSYEQAGKLHPIRLNERVIRYDSKEVEKLIKGDV